MSGRQVLVIEADVNGESYASCIYQEDGYLKELFTKKETFSGLQGGQELVALDTFSVSRPEESLLQFDLSADGQEETVFIRAAANGVAATAETAANGYERSGTSAGGMEE